MNIACVQIETRWIEEAKEVTPGFDGSVIGVLGDVNRVDRKERKVGRDIEERLEVRGVEVTCEEPEMGREEEGSDSGRGCIGFCILCDEEEWKMKTRIRKEARWKSRRADEQVCKRTLGATKDAASFDVRSTLELYSLLAILPRSLKEQRPKLSWSERGRREMRMSMSSIGRDSSEVGGPVLRATTEGGALYFSWFRRAHEMTS